MALNLNCCR